MSELLVLVPSRGRPHTVIELGAQLQAMNTLDSTRMVFIVDTTDPCSAEYHANALTAGLGCISTGSSTMVEALNQGWSMVGAGSDYVGFMGDDHRPITPEWDLKILLALESHAFVVDGPAMVYGNDLIHGRALPTQVFMSGVIPDVLDRMAPPHLNHMYVDNYWKALGEQLGALKYLPDVVIEHRHPLAGRGVEWDPGYDRVNDFMGPDSQTWKRMEETGYVASDVAQIRATLDRGRGLL